MACIRESQVLKPCFCRRAPQQPDSKCCSVRITRSVFGGGCTLELSHSGP